MEAIIFLGTTLVGLMFCFYYLFAVFNNRGSLGFRIVGGIIFIFYCMYAYGLSTMPSYVRCMMYDNRYLRCAKTNTGIIRAAVEFYNMDQKEENLMHNLDINLLKKGGYLNKLEDSYPDCEYYNEGDLTKEEYYIVCKRCGNFALNEKKRKEMREREKKTFKGLCISLASLISGFPY